MSRIKTAVILAAGMGSRLNDVTNDEIPKGLLKINGKTLIERSIEKLRSIGIEKIYIVTGHLSFKYDELANKYKFIKTKKNRKYKATGSMTSLAILENDIKEDFLLLESDLIYEVYALIKAVNYEENDCVLLSGKTNSGDELKELIYSKGMVRILEAHNGLTGVIVEKTKVSTYGKVKEFDGMWVSSLCDSTAKGKPDIEVVDLTSRLNTINDILEVTTKPIIVDGDTGGLIEHFVYTVKTLERLGVSAIIIEDKTGLKKNSLFGTDVKQTQDTIEHFSEKIRAGREARVTSDFMIIARIESLIAKAGMDDAIKRAKAYIEAGADGIMIHSKEKDGKEIIEFCQLYSKLENKVPLIVVPTSYNFIREQELAELGVNVVIYANHLIRSAYPAMVETAESILKNERCMEASENCMPIKEILNLIPGGK